MTILKILGGILAILLILALLSAFNEHCAKKFSHRFFSKNSFIATAASLGLIVGGYIWSVNASHGDGDPLNGYVLIAIGALIAGVMVLNNFIKTNLLYGLGGSALQLSLFSLLAYIGLPFLVIGTIVLFFASFSSRVVYVVNK